MEKSGPAESGTQSRGVDGDYGPKARYMVVAVDDLLVTSACNLIEYDQVRSSVLEGRFSRWGQSYLDARNPACVTVGPSHATMEG